MTFPRDLYTSSNCVIWCGEKLSAVSVVSVLAHGCTLILDIRTPRMNQLGHSLRYYDLRHSDLVHPGNVLRVRFASKRNMAETGSCRLTHVKCPTSFGYGVVSSPGT